MEKPQTLVTKGVRQWLVLAMLQKAEALLGLPKRAEVLLGLPQPVEALLGLPQRVEALLGLPQRVEALLVLPSGGKKVHELEAPGPAGTDLPPRLHHPLQGRGSQATSAVASTSKPFKSCTPWKRRERQSRTTR